jgi:hypothetical protein
MAYSNQLTPVNCQMVDTLRNLLKPTGFAGIAGDNHLIVIVVISLLALKVGKYINSTLAGFTV